MYLLPYFRAGYEEVAKTAAYLMQKTEYRPLIGIICGSGLGGLCDELEEPQAFPYSEIPGFAVSTGKYLAEEKTDLKINV